MECSDVWSPCDSFRTVTCGGRTERRRFYVTSQEANCCRNGLPPSMAISTWDRLGHIHISNSVTNEASQSAFRFLTVGYLATKATGALGTTPRCMVRCTYHVWCYAAMRRCRCDTGHRLPDNQPTASLSILQASYTESRPLWLFHTATSHKRRRKQNTKNENMALLTN